MPIRHISNGYYTIRPMHKLDMALDSTSGTVDIVSDDANDALVGGSFSNRWGIDYYDGGYVLKSANIDSNAMRCTAVYPGADVLTDTYSATNSVFHWTLSRITNPPSGVLLYDTSIGGVVTLPTKYMYVSESKSLAEFNLIPAVYAEGVNSAVFRWRNNNASFTVNSYTGEVTAISNSEEPALITGTSNYGTVQFEVYVLPIQDGTYFINNRLYNRLLQIDNSDSSIGYNTSGSTVGLQTFDGGDYQKWEITTLTDGYYSIISVESGLALSVASGEIEGNDISLVQEAYNNLNRQKWKITQTDRGYYMIKPKVAEDWDNYTDEWELWLVGLEAFLLGVNAPESGHDHYSIQGTIMPDLQELGYNSFNCIVTDFISLADTQEYLQQCKVFISRGHGGSDGNGTFICLAKSEESYLGTSNIYDFTAHTPIINLTNCDLAIFVGCSTSAVEGTSLPDAAIAAGAKYAIGFNEVIYCGAANNWTECFFQYCTEGYSVPLSALTAAGECSLSCRVVARSN